MQRIEHALILSAAFLVFLTADALARPPKQDSPTPTGSGTGSGTTSEPELLPDLSGTMLLQTAATTTWLLYPGACVERALGTWSAKSSPVADSLQPTAGYANSSGYVDGQPDIGGNNNLIAYTRADLSATELLWHVVDSSVPTPQRPAIINGSRSIWCGKYDANWPLKVGYPSMTFQILYIDTGAHSGSYNLTFTASISAELNYDALTILGGGTTDGNPAHNTDPLENRRDFMSDIVFGPAAAGQGGPAGDSQELACFTGSITSAQSVTANTGSSFFLVEGAGAGQPNAVTYSINSIPAVHRAIYLVFRSDDRFSSQDGLWPEGKGQVLDLISVSDNGSIYNDEVASGGSDHTAGSSIIKGTEGSFGFVSARIPAGIGELWQLAPGTENMTSDACAVQKTASTDLFFEGGDPNTNLTLNGQANSIVSCTFPISPGTASVFAQWTEYIDIPKYSGFVQSAQYRVFKGGAWSDWRNTSSSNAVQRAPLQAWLDRGDELTEAAQADSIQLRWTIECIPELAADRAHCSVTQANALLYDNLRLQVTSGVPGPLMGIHVGSIAQTTFVDGTIHGTNCSSSPCWPGIRGTDLGVNVGINDNFNSPFGDSVVVSFQSALRSRGMGINWRKAFDKSVNAGQIGPPGSEFAYTNASYNALYDTPRMIFRVFDPTTRTWSPFDSTELVADAVVVAGSDTTVVENGYRVDWPPYDKSIAGASLPGGFTVNGIAAYNSLRFMPRGSRIQYYFKAVDILGGTSYQFSSDRLAREVEDLPALPGSSIKAPDIIEWRVLPGVYPPGPGGSLLSGRTDTPLLNLDGSYTSWSFGYDPVLQALRALGVRADRYRLLQGNDGAAHIGGHELPGKRIEAESNFFPNYLEYPLVDSLATWYRILIESSHVRTSSIWSEQDAALIEAWWRKETGSNAGDRCIFLSGDDALNALLNTGGVDNTLQISAAQNIFGVASALNAWSGTSTNSFPTVDDRFAAATAGPALAAPNTLTYPLDGGCPGANRFDVFTKVGDSDAAAHAFYPSAQIAGIARSRELDIVADSDRNKALCYGYSIQFLRDSTYSRSNANYTRSGIEIRMRVLYKFLTGCRAAHAGSACWPCPNPTPETISSLQAEWATQSVGFNTATYGPLYPIQAAGLATAVENLGAGTVPFVNALGQNRPNPFNPETVIPYSLATPGRVVIRIFDIGGRLVRTLVDARETQGPHAVRWNGKTSSGEHAASGVYFYRITYPDGAASAKKMIVLR